MPGKAFIFDVGGTLIGQYTSEMYGNTLAGVADALGVERQAFTDLWLRDRNQIHHRFRGEVPFDQELVEVCGLLGKTPSAEQIQEACRVYTQATARWMTPREDAVDTLSHLRAAGCRVGVLSNCSWELPQVWQQSSLAPLVDAAVFSCDAGLSKPDPRIYLLACERLGVEPGQCVYVGDGSDNELTGAAEVGMHPVLICVPDDKSIVMKRDDPMNWTGPVIERLADIRSLSMSPTSA